MRALQFVFVLGLLNLAPVVSRGATAAAAPEEVDAATAAAASSGGVVSEYPVVEASDPVSGETGKSDLVTDDPVAETPVIDYQAVAEAAAAAKAKEEVRLAFEAQAKAEADEG